MPPRYPLSIQRLHALLGERMHDLPPHFIARLEQELEALDEQSARHSRGAHLHVVSGCTAEASGAECCRESNRGTTDVSIPARTVQGLDAILEILHSAHLARHDGDPEGVIGDHLVEGLIVSGRALLRGVGGASQGGG